MKGTLIGLILLLVAVLVILHGSEYGFPSVESFQDTILGLQPWAVPLFLGGMAIGILVLYFGGRELLDYKQKKALYYGFNMSGVTAAMNPPLYSSPRSRKKTRVSKYEGPGSKRYGASLRSKPKSRFAEPAPAVSLRSKPKSRFIEAANATKTRSTKLKVD
jgi:hypothetical protein